MLLYGQKIIGICKWALRITQCSVLTITIGEIEHEVYFSWEQDSWINDQEPYPHVSYIIQTQEHAQQL